MKTYKAKIGLTGIIKEHMEYTRKKAETGTSGSNLAGGDDSTLAGGYCSNLAGGNRSNLAGGYHSNLAGGYCSNLAGGDDSTLAGGYYSNLAGGNYSNLAGGDDSVIIGRNGCKAKAGKNSVIVLANWDYVDGEYKPTCVKAVVVDGAQIKADTWYTLVNGEIAEAEE